MPLSLQKLETLLSTQGFYLTKFFVMEELCMYMQINSVNTSDKFILYIPSKYKFEPPTNNANVFQLKYADISDSADTFEKYAGDSKVNPEDVYNEIEMDISADSKTRKVDEQLEDHYRRPIELKNISTDDTNHIKGIYRQLKRLKHCVQSIKYKVGIIYKNFLCVIRRDDSIDCFIIKKYSRNRTDRKLMIVVDLETMYEKLDKVATDVIEVNKSLQYILEKNQGMHARALERLLEQKNDVTTFATQAEHNRAIYDEMTSQLENMLRIMNTAEMDRVNQYQEIKMKYTEDSKISIHNDMDRGHSIAKLETELEDISNIKRDVYKILSSIKHKRQNSILLIDNIMFDNRVMSYEIFNNFKELKTLA